MQIKEAHVRLKELAGDKYCSTQYEMTSYPANNNHEGTNCRVYIAGYGNIEESTFTLALAEMERRVTGNPGEEKQTVEA